MVRRRKEQISFRRFSFPIPTNSPTPSRPMMAMAPPTIIPAKRNEVHPKSIASDFWSALHFLGKLSV